MTKPNLDVLAGAVDSLKIACKLRRDDLAAANQQLDAMRAELAMANASREKLSSKLADVQHAHSGSLDVVDHLRSELAALRQSTEADAEPVCWMVRSSLFDLPFMTEEAARTYAKVEGLTVRPAYERPAPVAPVPAPSRSARKVCSFCQDTEPRILNGDNSASVCGYCAGLHWDICRPDDPSPAARAEEPAGYASWSDPPDLAAEIAKLRKERDDLYQRAATDVHEACRLGTDMCDRVAELTAEIARLMMEKERKQHLLEERDAEIAKLKAEVDVTSTVGRGLLGERDDARAEIAKLKAQLDGTRRERIGHHYRVVDSFMRTSTWGGTQREDALAVLREWRRDPIHGEVKFLRINLYRLVRKPASGGGT